MNDNKQTSSDTTRFFHMPDDIENFSLTEFTFFKEAISFGEKPDDDIFPYDIVKDIQHIVSENKGNRARQLYKIAEFIRMEFTEDKNLEVNNLEYSPHREILWEAIYSVDNFKIAEELLRQYEEKINQVKAA